MNISPYATPLASPNGLRWLVLDLNSFFASCEQQETPRLRDKPIGIVHMQAETTCCIAASYAAKAFGVKTGTLVSEARKLCPSIEFVQSHPKLYVDYHHRILEAIETCAPIEDVMSIDEVACRLDTTQQNPIEARKLAVRMKQAIRERVGDCLTSSVGIASNKLLAKVASDMQKPDGLVLLEPEAMPAPLLKLELDDICGIGPRMLDRLHAVGIYDMQALWQASPEHLRRAWHGVTGARFHALLHGADLPNPSHPRRSLSHQHVLAPEQRTTEEALAVVRQLLVKAGQKMRTENFYAKRLILQIKWSQDLGYCVKEQTFKETQDTSFFLTVLSSLWKTVPKLKPLRIGIVLADLVSQEKHQPDLFDQRKPTALTVAVDKLNQKFGRGTVSFGDITPQIGTKISFQNVPDRAEM